MKPVIVIDNGSNYIKIGLSTDEKPHITMPALVGRPMLRSNEKISEELELKPIMVGDEVTPVRSLLELSHPMKNGIIVNDEDMGILWDYCVHNKLGLKQDELKDRRVLITEAPSNPNSNKTKMGEILFEKLGIGAFNIEPQAKLTLFCEGLESGIVLECGDSVSHCIPISDGFLLHHFIQRLDVAGRDITDYLIRLLQAKGYAFNSTADFERIREYKEKYCFVSCDLERDRLLDKETTYYNSFEKLPDGTKVRISNEKFEAPEILFQPHLIEVAGDGIHEQLFNSINKCPMDVRKSLYENIVLSGGSTMFPGFASRIENEIRKLYIKTNLSALPEDQREIKIKINILDSPRRKFSVFSGACVLGKAYNNDNEQCNAYWITKLDWDEVGPDIILKKCANIML